MHATTRWYTDASLADMLAARADDIRAVIGEVPGLRAYYLVKTDQGTLTVTVCDDEAGTAASTRVAAEWIAANLGDLSISPPSVASGEVLLDV